MGAVCMSRPHFEISPEYPVHVSARTNNRDWFSLPLEEVWAIMEDYLFFLHRAFGIQIHSFVLMSNHFHLIVTCPDANLSQAMCYFLRETSKQIARQSNRTNHLYGNRYFRSQIRSHHYYLHAYKYIYRNPIRAGLCKRVEEYPFSTLAGLLGLRKIVVPVCEDATLFSSVEKTLCWLNEEPDPNRTEAIRLALKRPVYEYKVLRRLGRSSDLVVHPY
jgi:REP element-mobilizing transposase RayT